jgi:hypothetical protein
MPRLGFLYTTAEIANETRPIVSVTSHPSHAEIAGGRPIPPGSQIWRLVIAPMLLLQEKSGPQISRESTGRQGGIRRGVRKGTLRSIDVLN